MRPVARWVAPLALGAAALSLLLNVLLLWMFASPERWFAPTLLRTLDRLDAEDARLRFSVTVPAGTPLNADVPLDERLQVSINARLPIDTRVNLPIHSPLGNYNVAVPIRTSIPIRTQLPVHIQHTVRLRTSTRQGLLLPIEVPVRDLPLDAIRNSLHP